MGRILAIDYGTKRTGLAVTDPLKIIAGPLAAVHTSELLPFLNDYLTKESVELIVVGEPVPDEGAESKVEKEIVGFLRKFAVAHPNIPVQREDERFTTREALQTIRQAGAGKKLKKDKSLADTVSAVIILQQYMGHR
jgi:putative Holliday junction resolvase